MRIIHLVLPHRIINFINIYGFSVHLLNIPLLKFIFKNISQILDIIVPMDTKDDLLLSLFNLAQRINSHGGVLPGESMLERYKYFLQHSENKENCTYARKCKDLFLNYDYEDIKVRFLEVLELIRLVEGKNFGR